MSLAVSTFSRASDQLDALNTTLYGEAGGAARVTSPFGACLVPLLTEIGWRGAPKQICEVLPHFVSNLGLADLRNILARLGYRTRLLRMKSSRFDHRLLPYLFVTDHGKPYVATNGSDGAFALYDGGAGDWVDARSVQQNGTAYVVEKVDTSERKTRRAEGNWFRELVGRFRGVVALMLAITFVSNILALAVPLFVMAVYDRVIGQNSPETLGYLAVGLVCALLWEYAFRTLRAKALAFVGARLDYLTSTAAFSHILHLPPAFTERAAVGAQVSRLREFESLREFFTSPLGTVVLDLPFAVLFIGAVALIAPPLALVPITMIALYALLGALLLPHLRKRFAVASLARSERHGFLVETLSKMRAIKQCGAEDVWWERYRGLSADAAVRDFRARLSSALLQTMAYAIMVGAGVATLAGGALLVLTGDVTTGGLVASMALVWRVLAPLQLLFSTATRFENVRNALRQLNQLMQFQPERDPDLLPSQRIMFEGGITFSRVSLRYTANEEPALLGVSFDIAPGEVVAVVGSNGSGKSTLVKLIAGLYAPQGGSVQIDGIDIRQVDPIDLRQAISYMPQYSHHFYGTIAQNLRFAKPDATNDDLYEAARIALVDEDISSLPDGFETRIGDRSVGQLPSGFHQRLALARAYLRDAPIMLFDEPATTLDENADIAFMNAIRHFAGQRTVLMATHRPSHMKLSDKILFLRDGRLELFGPTSEVLPQLQRIGL